MQKTDSAGTTTYVGGLYEIYPTGGVAQDVGNLGNGVACLESTTGTGYLMYSQESFHTRLSNPGPHGNNADHFICVLYRNETWQYDSNYEYAAFTPRPSDVLVAEVDYTNDTVSSLEGVNSSYQGIQKGYADGDLTYRANIWNNVYNTGEFEVAGSTITPHAGSDVRKTYTFGGQSVAVYKDGTLSYLHSDHLNSANVATDASGNKVTGSDTRYKPFGGTTGGSSMPTDRLYTGQREIASLDLYNYNARYYDPYIGRFIQADTIIPDPGNSQDFNRYSYVRNNPLKYIDPNGHILLEAAIILVIGGAVLLANPQPAAAPEPGWVAPTDVDMHAGTKEYLDTVPGTGDISDIYALATGKRLFTGEPQGRGESGLYVGLAVLPVVTGGMVKQARRLLSCGDELAGLAPVARHVLDNALQGFKRVDTWAGGEMFSITKKKMVHILSRHHPQFWDALGEGYKGLNTSFDFSSSIDEVVDLAKKTLQLGYDNRTLMEDGITWQYITEIDGIWFQAKTYLGKLVQFHPLAE